MKFNLTPPAVQTSFEKMLKDENIKVSHEYTRHARKGRVRDFEVYSIQIDSVDDLLYLLNTINPPFGLVISKSGSYNSFEPVYFDKTDEPYEYTLEIYDGWRE